MTARPPETLSHSAMSTYYRCGEQYRRRYIEREVMPAGIAALAGSAVHSAVEAYYRKKRDEAAELSVDDVKQAAADAFDARAAKGEYMLDADEQARGKEVVLAEGKDKAVRLAALHRVTLAPSIQPDLIEARIEVDVPGIRRRLVGIVDLATVAEPDAPEGVGGDIVDLKTSKKRGSQEDVDRSLQLTWYDVAYQALTGRRARRVVHHELVDTKTPQANVIESSRDDNDRRVLAGYIQRAEQGIDAGVFLPAAIGSWCCSERFCAFAPTCPYFPTHRGG